MKAMALLVGNYDEIVKAQKEQELLNLPRQEEIKVELTPMEFHFALGAVSTCFKTLDGKIKCQIAGVTVLLVWDDEVFNKIATFLETR